MSLNYIIKWNLCVLKFINISILIDLDKAPKHLELQIYGNLQKFSLGKALPCLFEDLGEEIDLYRNSINSQMCEHTW